MDSERASEREINRETQRKTERERGRTTRHRARRSETSARIYMKHTKHLEWRGEGKGMGVATLPLPVTLLPLPLSYSSSAQGWCAGSFIFLSPVQRTRDALAPKTLQRLSEVRSRESLGRRPGLWALQQGLRRGLWALQQGFLQGPRAVRRYLEVLTGRTSP